MSQFCYSVRQSKYNDSLSMCGRAEALLMWLLLHGEKDFATFSERESQERLRVVETASRTT
jgi:hypothetical protein